MKILDIGGFYMYFIGEGGYQHPLPSDFNGFLYPRVRRYAHFCFCKMTSKDGVTIT